MYQITLVADGRFALTRCWDNSKVWDTATGTVKETLPSDFGGWTGGLCLSPDRRHLCRFTTAEIGADGFAKSKPTVLDIHDIATGQLVQHLELRHPYGSGGANTTPLAFHLDTGWLATTSEAYLELWNLKTGKLWARWLPHEGALFGAVAMSHDGQILATTSGNMLRLWPLPFLQQEVEKLQR